MGEVNKDSQGVRSPRAANSEWKLQIKVVRKPTGKQQKISTDYPFLYSLYYTDLSKFMQKTTVLTMTLWCARPVLKLQPSSICSLTQFIFWFLINSATMATWFVCKFKYKDIWIATALTEFFLIATRAEVLLYFVLFSMPNWWKKSTISQKQRLNK